MPRQEKGARTCCCWAAAAARHRRRAVRLWRCNIAGDYGEGAPRRATWLARASDLTRRRLVCCLGGCAAPLLRGRARKRVRAMKRAQ